MLTEVALTTADLDARFRRVHVQLEVCSTVPAVRPGRSSSSEQGHAVLCDPWKDDGQPRGAERPPADLWAARYARCDDDDDRLAVIRGAEDELCSLRRLDPEKRKPGDSAAEHEQHMLDRTESFSPEEVGQSALGITSGHIKKLRRRHGLDVQTGRPRENLTRAEQESETIRLWEMGGKNRHEIARTVGLHHQQVQRLVTRHQQAAPGRQEAA